MSRISGLLLMLLLTAQPHAADRDPAGYERILIPVYAEGRPGPFGALWETELLVRNEADESAQIFQSECVFFCNERPRLTCTITQCIPTDAQPRSPAVGALTRAGKDLSNVGAFIYVNRSRAADLSAQLRIRDASRETQTWGTEIPVVRDADMRRDHTYLHNIPIRDGFREHLRLYGASSPSGGGDLLVRVYAGDGNEIVAERSISLTPGTTAFDVTPPRLPTDNEFPEVPAYAEINPLRQIVPEPRSTQIIRLEIVPLTPGLKYWAMVSVTNNATHHVTLVTPQ